MKFLVILLALAAAPALGGLLRDRHGARLALLSVMGFLPFFSIDLNLVSYETYRGDTRGVEITLLDLAALSLWFGLPQRSTGPAPFAWIATLYVMACALSVTVAQNQLFAVFSIWKLARMLFLLHVLAAALRDPRAGAALLTGLVAGVAYEGASCLHQRYVLHWVRVSGSLSHPNSLGMAVNLVSPMAFALALAGQGGRLALPAVGLGALGVVLSLSRGSLMMFIAGHALVFIGSSLRRVTTRKALIFAAVVAAAAVVSIKALDTIIERFTSAPAASEEARERFEEASSLMLDDHPMGVGINQFSSVLSDDGYADVVGIPPIDRDGIVHNIYWLTAAETGYLGLATYVPLLLLPLLTAYVGAVRRRGIEGDLLLGAAAGLTVMYVQGKAEWIARQTFMLYLFIMVISLIGALARPTAAPPSRTS